MPFIKNLLDKIDDFFSLDDNKDFLEGVMAACAIVAQADNEISFSERMKLSEILHKVARLKDFEPTDAVDLFNDFVNQLQGPNRKKAKADMLQQIHDTFSSPENQVILIRICWAISKADKKIEQEDYEAIEEIAKAIGVDFRKVYDLF